MIRRFGPDTALMLVDVQRGVDALEHWGGPTGRRNNPEAEARMLSLLGAWRGRGWPVAFTRHDSREAASPLKLSLPTGAQKEGFEPAPGDIVVEKDVNSAFLSIDREAPMLGRLREAGARRLVVAGFFTNMCVETSVRMAGNMGLDVHLVHDACATTNRVGPDGTDHDPETVHALSVASMHGEFCTAITTRDALALMDADAPHLERVQGNDPSVR